MGDGLRLALDAITHAVCLRFIITSYSVKYRPGSPSPIVKTVSSRFKHE